MACQNTEFARGIPLLMLNQPTANTATLTPQSSCPCGSGASLQQCCAPRLDGTRPAQTAEQLMRSRYTAHVVCQVDYLLRTWRSPDPAAVDPDAVRQWAQQSDWRGLTVHRCLKGGPGDSEGWVEFTAAYVDTTGATPGLQQHREKSFFIRQDGEWFYVDGETVPVDKPGRNSACPCGSGKKFKRCCGA